MADDERGDRVEAVWKRTERREAANKREADARTATRKATRKAMQSLAHYDRDKPTPEQAARGVFEVERAEVFDSSRKGEKVLVNRMARGSGAATMLKRGQISAREFKAAEKLCELYERAQMSQLSGLPMKERVQGGSVDTSGGRLRAAAMAFGEYRSALETLTRAGRVLVENCVVLGRPMEEAVRSREVAHRLGDLKTLDRQRNRATLIVAEALESLADHFQISKR